VKSEKILYLRLIDLPISPYAVATLPREIQNVIFQQLFIHDSDYLRYISIKGTATVTVQLSHNC